MKAKRQDRGGERPDPKQKHQHARQEERDANKLNREARLAAFIKRAEAGRSLFPKKRKR